MKKELDPTKPVMAHTMNVMRVATFATLPMMTWMPTVRAILCFLTKNVALNLV